MSHCVLCPLGQSTHFEGQKHCVGKAGVQDDRNDSTSASALAGLDADLNPELLAQRAVREAQDVRRDEDVNARQTSGAVHEKLINGEKVARRCRPRTLMGPWSPCNEPCGGGRRFRWREVIECGAPPNLLPSTRRSKLSRTCNAKPCSAAIAGKAPPRDVIIPQVNEESQ